ncbi:hypothetical protein [Sphingopyxis sp. 22461]|uniref:hypothetical protein n=1 Tax=Sphingopyxis sp. 22461 TaxID=3453923 RepID=UPI003F82ABE4
MNLIIAAAHRKQSHAAIGRLRQAWQQRPCERRVRPLKNHAIDYASGVGGIEKRMIAVKNSESGEQIRRIVRHRNHGRIVDRHRHIHIACLQLRKGSRQQFPATDNLAFKRQHAFAFSPQGQRQVNCDRIGTDADDAFQRFSVIGDFGNCHPPGELGENPRDGFGRVAYGRAV